MRHVNRPVFKSQKLSRSRDPVAIVINVVKKSAEYMLVGMHGNSCANARTAPCLFMQSD